MILKELIDSFFSGIENKAKSNYFSFKLAFLLMTISWILVFPKWPTLIHDYVTWQTVFLKSRDLTNSLTHIEPFWGHAKKVFRLTVPVLIRLFSLNVYSVLFIQSIIGYLILVLCFELSNRIVIDKVQAVLFTSGIAFTYFGRVAFFDVNYTFFDAFSYFFLLLAMYNNNLFLIFIFSSMAAWNDERGFLALGIVFLFHFFSKRNFEKVNSLSLRLSPQCIGILSSIFTYIILRVFLSWKFNMHTPSDGANISMWSRTCTYMPIGMLSFLEGYWLLIIVSLTISFYNRDIVFIVSLLICLILFVVVAGSVTDITRSGSYVVPILFVAIGYLKSRLPIFEMRVLLLISFVFSLLIPQVFICPDWEMYSVFYNSISAVRKFGLYLLNH